MMIRQRRILAPALMMSVCLISIFFLFSCKKSSNPVDDGNGNGTKPAPVIDRLDVTAVIPGDTVTIYGSNFDSSVGGNRVIFNNLLASVSPFAATDTTLEAEVPDYAASGPVWVEVSGQKSNGVPLAVSHDVGDVWVIEGASTSHPFEVATTTGNEVHLIIPFSASSQPTNYSYDLAPGTVTASFDASTTTGQRLERSGVQEVFTTDLRQHAFEHLDRYAPQIPDIRQRRETGQPESGQTQTLYVLNTTNTNLIDDPAGYTTVTAHRRYGDASTQCYIYVDENTPINGFTQQDYDALGAQFDQSIYVTDTTYFGQPTDVDDDHHVTILFTPVVNDLTPDNTAQYGFIAGFFNPIDLVPTYVPQGTSNGMEIFYVLVPDPLGDFGNLFTTQQVKDVTPGILAHEFEHMISIGFRMFEYGFGFTQDTWFEEGMAHMAEDLNSIYGSNVKRANRYLTDPGGVPLMGYDSLAQRGGIFLLLRYAGDQYGDQIYRRMVETSRVGMSTLELVTGKPFFTTFADWLATLYLTGKTITSDSRYHYSSTHTIAKFDTLLVRNRNVSDGIFNGSVYGASGDYLLYHNPTPPAIEFVISAGSAAALRAVVVRTQ